MSITVLPATNRPPKNIVITPAKEFVEGAIKQVRPVQPGKCNETINVEGKK